MIVTTSESEDTMPQAIARYYSEIKLLSEYTILPLHILSLAHHYSLTVTIGGAIIILYTLASLQHARTVKEGSK